MSDAFVIEIDNEPAGIVARTHGEPGYRFYASTAESWSLDGLWFKTPREAEAALRRARMSGQNGSDSARKPGLVEGIRSR
jgi:hypothetical protein